MAIHALRRIRQSVRNKNVEGAEDSLDGVPKTLVAFLKVDPPIFNGSTNPIEADNWFKVMECALQIQHIPNNQFVEYATYQLEAFYKKYLHESIKEARKLEFLQLKQGSMTIAEYTSKFEELCKFSRISQGAPESYEGWKCIKYQVGLREDIMCVVAPLEIRRFSELVDKATIVEDYTKEVTLERDVRGSTSSKVRGK
ncbi:hypothetical protein AHAS_Ahas07G0113000 [Arachis hypogaea]